MKMFQGLASIAWVAALAVLVCQAGALSVRGAIPDSASVTPFDGQYLSPNEYNSQTEWWYAQAVAEPIDDSPPMSVIIVFQLGFLFGDGDASEAGGPEYTMRLSGSFPNGTNFYYIIPVESTNVASAGPETYGNWTGAGVFFADTEINSFLAFIDIPDLGITGSIALVANGAPHYPCGGVSNPYFNSITPSGVSLNQYEEVFFEQFGWAVAITGGEAIVELDIEGIPLHFVGTAYHDHNFAPAPMNAFDNQWYWVQAHVGPYDFTGMLLEPLNSSYVLVSGYLSESGSVLQDQCSLNGTKTTDVMSIVPYGAQTNSVTGEVVPVGFDVGFSLSDGTQYSFTLTSQVTNPSVAYYYRWVGTATGGEVGGQQYNGTTIFEWLDPGLAPYSP